MSCHLFSSLIQLDWRREPELPFVSYLHSKEEEGEQPTTQLACSAWCRTVIQVIQGYNCENALMQIRRTDYIGVIPVSSAIVCTNPDSMLRTFLHEPLRAYLCSICASFLFENVIWGPETLQVFKFSERAVVFRMANSLTERIILGFFALAMAWVL